MESFYKNWLKKNAEEDERALKELKKQDQSSEVKKTGSSGNDTTVNQLQSIPSIYDNPIPSTSSAFNPQIDVPTISENVSPTIAQTASVISDIVYQRDGLELLVERGMFQRQKKFSLQVFNNKKKDN